MEVGVHATRAAACLLGLLTNAAVDAAPIDDMLAMMAGTYYSDSAAAPTDAELPDLLDRRARVTAPAFGEHVMYWQLNSGPEREVYRQRLLVFEATPGGEIIQKTWSFLQPEKFVDAFDNRDLFAGLSRALADRTGLRR